MKPQQNSIDQEVDELRSLSAYDFETGESQYTDLEREKLNTDLLRETLESKKQDRQQRRDFASYIFWLIVVYLTIVLALVGCSRLIGIDNSVLITLLGTTTANVISLFAFVAKYLFHTKE